MTRIALTTHPLLLGFERTPRPAERRAPDAYPPTDIELCGDDALRVTLAVAGFAEDDLEIMLEGRTLIVRGRSPEADRPRAFLHRGLASRAFQRSFALAPEIEVAGASLRHGLLQIDLRRRPETPRAAQTIPITRRAEEAET